MQKNDENHILWVWIRVGIWLASIKDMLSFSTAIFNLNIE